MAAGIYKLVIEQGETFQRAFKVKYKSTGLMKDYSGWTAAMQIRKSHTSTTVILSLTTANSKIVAVTGNPNYNVLIDIPAADTAALAAGEYVYDIEMSQGAFVEKLLKGKLVVEPEVTKV